MKLIKRLALVHPIPDPHQKADAGALLTRGPGQLGDACDASVVDGGQLARMRGAYFDLLRCGSGFAETALCRANCHELCLRCTTIEKRLRAVPPPPSNGVRCEVQKMSGQIQRPRTQVARCIRRAPQNREHVVRLQRRAHATSHRGHAIADM